MGDSNYSIINRKLYELQLPQLDKLDKKIQEYLFKMENVIQNFENERNESINGYKSRKINILSVTKEAQIARQTIYNHKDILEKYITKSQEEQEQNDIFVKIDFLYNKIRELERDIYSLQLRDVTIEEMKYENSILIETIKNDKQIIQSLEKHNKQLIDRVSSLEKDLNNSGKKLIMLNDKKKQV